MTTITSPQKKHCRGLCHKVHRIDQTLTNLINQLKHRSPTSLTTLYPRGVSAHRSISPKYLKVTQIANKINGVEEVQIARHHTDNSEMKKILEWDNQEQFTRPHQQYYSNVIKTRHDQKLKQLERLRDESKEKEWEKIKRNEKYVDNSINFNEKPRFNNEIIQEKTKDYGQLVSRDSNSLKQTKYKYKQEPEDDSEQKIKLKTKQKKERRTQKDRRGDYLYRKKIVTRYRQNHQIQSSQTDSDFSRFEL